MKNIKSKLFGFVAAVVVALSLPATGHSQILYNGYFNIDWQYNWPLGDSYADKSSGWGISGKQITDNRFLITFESIKSKILF